MSPCSSFRYRVDNVRVSVVDSSERVTFKRSKYHASLPENLPAGSLLATDEDVTLCSSVGGGVAPPDDLKFELVASRAGAEDAVSLVPLGSDLQRCLVFQLR